MRRSVMMVVVTRRRRRRGSVVHRSRRSIHYRRRSGVNGSRCHDVGRRSDDPRRDHRGRSDHYWPRCQNVQSCPDQIYDVGRQAHSVVMFMMMMVVARSCHYTGAGDDDGDGQNSFDSLCHIFLLVLPRTGFGFCRFQTRCEILFTHITYGKPDLLSTNLFFFLKKFSRLNSRSGLKILYHKEREVARGDQTKNKKSAPVL